MSYDTFKKDIKIAFKRANEPDTNLISQINFCVRKHQTDIDEGVINCYIEEEKLFAFLIAYLLDDAKEPLVNDMAYCVFATAFAKNHGIHLKDVHEYVNYICHDFRKVQSQATKIEEEHWRKEITDVGKISYIKSFLTFAVRIMELSSDSYVEKICKQFDFCTLPFLSAPDDVQYLNCTGIFQKMKMIIDNMNSGKMKDYLEIEDVDKNPLIDDANKIMSMGKDNGTSHMVENTSCVKLSE